MSNVPVSRRKDHDFITNHKMHNLRKRITELAINDFGYDHDRVEKQIEKFAEYIQNQPNAEETIAKMREKNESYYKDFVQEETVITRDIFRKIVSEYEIGNSIFPDGEALIEEFKERRLHFDLAVGWIFCMKQELQYIAETLPGDKNRYEKICDELEELVRLVRGVRRSANRFLKQKKK